jgi:4-carboxymuconolactone decarboxylase
MNFMERIMVKNIAVGIALSAALTGAAEAQETKKNPRVAPAAVYEVAPGLGHFTDDTLFGEVWLRKELSPRDRSLITVATLVATGKVAQISSHTKRALDNGVTPEEIGELITHLAFYSGWPSAISAVTEVKKVFDERGIAAAKAADTTSKAIRVIHPTPANTVAAPKENFTGDVRVSNRYQGDAPARVGGATVSFAPGARTAWHRHPAGQTLYIVSGKGWVQMEGGPREEFNAGDVVWIPPNVKHWHGATTEGPMTHFTIAEAVDGSAVTWMEAVSEDTYTGKNR